MKKRLTILISFLLFVAGDVHTETTNDFRIWKGKLYNVQKSILWTTLPPESIYSEHFATGSMRSMGNLSGGMPISSDLYEFVLIVKSIGTNSVVCHCGMIHNGNSYVTENNWCGQVIIIIDHPKQKTFVTGDKIDTDKFLYIGNTNINKIIVKVYEYGLSNSAENRKTLTNH